jgi:ribosome-associated protein
MSPMPPEPPAIPEWAIEERFLAATGPGGQNVNKVAVACQLRLDARALGLAPDVFARLERLAGSRMSGDGAITVTARRFRTRKANRLDARERLAELVAQAKIAPVRRRPTRPSKAAKAKRVDEKKSRSAVKQARGKVTDF